MSHREPGWTLRRFGKQWAAVYDGGPLTLDEALAEAIARQRAPE